MKGRNNIRTWVSVDHREQRDYSCYMPNGYYWEVIQGAPTGCYTVRSGRHAINQEAYAEAFRQQRDYCDTVNTLAE